MERACPPPAPLQGSYGRVYLARLHETPCAVKVLLGWQEGEGGQPPERQALTLSSPLLADLHKEAGVMAALHHPNCVTLMGVCADPAAIVTGKRGRAGAGRRLVWRAHPARLRAQAAPLSGCLVLQSTAPGARFTTCWLQHGATPPPPASSPGPAACTWCAHAFARALVPFFLSPAPAAAGLHRRGPGTGCNGSPKPGPRPGSSQHATLAGLPCAGHGCGAGDAAPRHAHPAHRAQVGGQRAFVRAAGAGAVCTAAS